MFFSGQGQVAPSPSTAAQRRAHRRLTREDNRYHSGNVKLYSIRYKLLWCAFQHKCEILVRNEKQIWVVEMASRNSCLTVTWHAKHCSGLDGPQQGHDMTLVMGTTDMKLWAFNKRSSNGQGCGPHCMSGKDSYGLKRLKVGSFNS